MSDDIVTRLRERAASEAANESYFNSLLEKAGFREYMINSLSYEAADEIERLRGETEYWHAMADRCDPNCSCLKDSE